MLVLASGTLVDALYHAMPSAPLSALGGADGHTAHLIIFLGMLLVVLSLLRQALRGPARTSTHSK